MQEEKLKYKLSQEDCDSIWYAQRDNPGASLFGTPQERSNNQWKLLGEKHGFKWETVELSDEDLFILAVPNVEFSGEGKRSRRRLE